LFYEEQVVEAKRDIQTEEAILITPGTIGVVHEAQGTTAYVEFRTDDGARHDYAWAAVGPEDIKAVDDVEVARRKMNRPSVRS
jgi:hypothetical protein